MVTSLLSSVVLIGALTASGTEETRGGIFESQADLTPQCRIDELVFAKLKSLGIEPARLCSDAVFVRRVYLDVIGTVPTAEEAKAFLEDQKPDKRRALIDRLLEREEFADYWALKWSDLLRIKAEFPINLWPHAAQSYHRWVRTAIRENMPYDRFARELLTASGSNFRVPQVNFYRAMQGKQPATIAQTVALTFMGTRAEKWPKEQAAGMTALFAQTGYKGTAEWKEEIVFFDLAKAQEQAAAGASKKAAFPDGTPAALTPDRDPREAFADWLIAPKNPWFTRNIANRVWCWLLGRGIIHEPDDIRPDNPPSHPELLAYLQQELIQARYDLKHLYRLILNSKTYQLSSIPRSDKPEAATHFAHYAIRRLEAEVLIDALCQITGTTEKYSSIIPEPYTFIPEDHRSIALPDGSISSSFLEQFGRPSRDTGMEAERNNRLTPDQRLHLLNSSHIRTKIEQSPTFKALFPQDPDPKSKQAVARVASKGGKDAKSKSSQQAKIDWKARQKAEAQSQAEAVARYNEIVTTYYLMILSRFPTEEELKLVAAHSPPSRGKMRSGPTDLAWALINSSEFLYRH